MHLETKQKTLFQIRWWMQPRLWTAAQSEMKHILWDADRPLQSAAATFSDSGGREGFPSTSPPSTSYAHTIQPSYLRQVSQRSKKKHAQGREFSHFSRQKSVLAEKGWEKALQKSDLHIWHQQADFIHRLLKSTLRSIDFKVNFLVILHANALNPRYPESISIMWIL